MASRRRKQGTSYNTYGSVAYAPAYQSGAVRAPGYEETARPLPRKKSKERLRALERAQVRVREAGMVSPFAVVGFLAVGVFAALLLVSYVQLATVSDQMLSMRGELTQLQTLNADLSAQYERVFDINRIQQAIGDTMVRPTADQIVYIDLAEPDNVVIYGEQQPQGSFTESIQEITSNLVEYFH